MIWRSKKLEVQERKFFQRFDMNLALVVLALNVVGLINLYSATHGFHESINTRLFWQQLVWVSGGWIVFIGMTLVGYQFLYRFAWAFYIFNVLALLAVDIHGKIYYGAQRWLDLGFMRYQPSETAKLGMVLILARILSKKFSPGGLGVKDILLPLFIGLVPFALCVDQPDLGTGLLILFICIAMLFFVKVKRSIVVSAILLAAVTIPIAWKFGLKEYQRNRVITFLSPGSDPRGTGYNSIQAKIAVGSGKILGKGFRKGTQSQLEFIPERHSDFIFCVLSEEHGFVGSLTTLGLFIVLFLMCLKIATQARDRFGVLLVVGITAILFFHVFINLGMVIGLLPIVGVPLPLLSYGGSSMLTIMTGLGIVSAVAYRRYLF